MLEEVPKLEARLVCSEHWGGCSNAGAGEAIILHGNRLARRSQGSSPWALAQGCVRAVLFARLL